ncbi:hypothetical protein Q31a_40310 [Aureliella helgolandensis]|uniref:Uncharacterized protein n=1 Tax=Aureliella helgolandensis TaxID=2527968 RepID=A0A518GAS3_9BACT|nr:hypothetical protein Q31a_40310 [Aureliella helgolandensis]
MTQQFGNRDRPITVPATFYGHLSRYSRRTLRPSEAQKYSVQVHQLPRDVWKDPEVGVESLIAAISFSIWRLALGLIGLLVVADFRSVPGASMNPESVAEYEWFRLRELDRRTAWVDCILHTSALP